MVNIVLFGPPGAGKGTQAGLLVRKYGFCHVSTGEIIRTEISRHTPLGIDMEEYISRGELAPDDLVLEMVTQHLTDNPDTPGNIFDGFPRTTVQAEHFDILLNGHGLSVAMMFSLEVPEEEVVKRLLLRGKESGRADDSGEDVIRNRLNIYEQTTRIVSDYYSACGKYTPVDGTGTVDEIHSRLSAEIEKLL